MIRQERYYYLAWLYVPYIQIIKKNDEEENNEPQQQVEEWC